MAGCDKTRVPRRRVMNNIIAGRFVCREDATTVGHDIADKPLTMLNRDIKRKSNIIQIVFCTSVLGLYYCRVKFHENDLESMQS